VALPSHPACSRTALCHAPARFRRGGDKGSLPLGLLGDPSMKQVLVAMLLLLAGWFLVAAGLVLVHELRVELIALGLSTVAFIGSFITSIRLVKPTERRAINVVAAATNILAGAGLVLLAVLGLALIFFEQWLKSVGV